MRTTLKFLQTLHGYDIYIPIHTYNDVKGALQEATLLLGLMSSPADKINLRDPDLQSGSDTSGIQSDSQREPCV